MAGHNTKAYSLHYIVCNSNPYGHYTVELIDAFGVIWPILLEVAFTATIVLLCDKCLGAPLLLIFFHPPEAKPLLRPWSCY